MFATTGSGLAPGHTFVYVALPTGEDVLMALGWETDDEELAARAQGHVEMVTALVRAYTRSRGFEHADPFGPETRVVEEVAAVIISAAARSLANPSQSRRVEAGGYSELPGSLESLSLLETLTLNGYRRTAG